MDEDKYNFKYVPQSEMPKSLEDFPYRLYCSLCRKAIVACEEPIPQEIIDKCKGVPCSDCVDPFDWMMREMRRNK